MTGWSCEIAVAAYPRLVADHDDTTRMLVQEFTLVRPDADGTAAGIVARSRVDGVPLLTSVDDARDVAMVDPLPHPIGDADRREALDPLVASWGPTREYRPRVIEQSGPRPAHFRMAVTDHGNDEAVSAASTSGHPGVGVHAEQVGLLWIGAQERGAGTMVLVGDERPSTGPNDTAVRGSRRAPARSALGARVYTGRSPLTRGVISLDGHPTAGDRPANGTP